MRLARLVIALSVLAASTALIAAASLPGTNGQHSYRKDAHNKSADFVVARPVGEERR